MRVVSNSNQEPLQTRCEGVGNGKHNDLIARDGTISLKTKKQKNAILFPACDDDCSLKNIKVVLKNPPKDHPRGILFLGEGNEFCYGGLKNVK